jgi:predicted transcriptional regulator YheO
MNKSDRMKLVALLDETGVFQLKKSVPLVARRVGVTRRTVYNYLAGLGGEKDRVSGGVG